PPQPPGSSRVVPLPAATDIDPPSLHDALPISAAGAGRPGADRAGARRTGADHAGVRTTRARAGSGAAGSGAAGTGGSDDHDPLPDRKSTRLNSSHVKISYAVSGLK